MEASKAEIIDEIKDYSIEITYNLGDSNLNSEDSLRKLESEAVSPNFFYSHYLLMIRGICSNICALAINFPSNLKLVF